MRKRILIVEDDDLFRDALTDYLDEAYDIAIAETAEKALPLLKKESPDMLLLDITLPGMNGIELLRLVREDWPELPAIIITAHNNYENRNELSKLGAYAYFTKPLEPEVLLDTLSKALRP